MKSKVSIAIKKMSATAIARKGIRENLSYHQIKTKISARRDRNKNLYSSENIDVNTVYLQALAKEKHQFIFDINKNLVLEKVSRKTSRK